jgi:hypothetical protein
MSRFRTGAIGLAVLLAACSGDSTGPDLTPLQSLALNRDVALVAADAAAQDVEIMGGPVGLFGLGLGAAADGAEELNHPFHCGTRERDHLTVVRTCVFKDATGATQTGYDALTTASVAIHAEIDGEIERENWSASVHRVRELLVTGLAGTETQRTWNGTGVTTATRSRHRENTETRQYDVRATCVITNVVVGVPRSENLWPLSGTITKEVTVKITGGPHDGETRTRTVTITFNGTQTVQVKVGENTFMVDLRSRRING